MNRFGQLAVLVIGACVLVFASLLISSASVNQNDPGSTSNGRAGTLALYTWLNELGMTTSRIEGSYNFKGIDTLVIADPTIDYTTSDVSVVDTFVRHGGNVILADDQGLSAPLLQHFGISLDAAAHGGTAHNVGSIGLQDDVHNVPFTNAGAISGPKSIDFLRLDGQVVASQFKVGSGYLNVVSSELPISNDGLRQLDSARFVLALMEKSRGPNVGFDEYHHGVTGSASSLLGPGIGDIFAGPLGLAVLLGVALGIFALAVNGRRLGKPQPSRDPAMVPSAAEHIADLTELFARVGDRSQIVVGYVDELKKHVASRTGVSANVSDEQFLSSLTTGPVERTRELLLEGRRLENSKPNTNAIVSYAQAVTTLEKTWSNG